jgi:hypothetical protein
MMISQEMRTPESSLGTPENAFRGAAATLLEDVSDGSTEISK